MAKYIVRIDGEANITIPLSGEFTVEAESEEEATEIAEDMLIKSGRHHIDVDWDTDLGSDVEQYVDPGDLNIESVEKEA